MIYLLKVSLLILLFYALYKLALQRETFVQSNRAYLLFGLFASLMTPLIEIPVYIEYTPAFLESNTNNFSTIINTHTMETSFNWEWYLILLYSVVLLGLIFKFVWDLSALKVSFKKNVFSKKDGYRVIETNQDVTPFSFFNYIFYNPKTFNTRELNHILNHEKVHAREFHSIDKLFSHLFCMILWFNPFMWLYKKEIEQNLEFIADQKAQNNASCKKSYQLLLLKTSLPKTHYLITNNFYNSQIKKRILMLHRSKSKRINVLKYILIVPLLAIFLMSFNTKEIYIEKQPTNKKENTLENSVSTKTKEEATFVNPVLPSIALTKQATINKPTVAPNSPNANHSAIFTSNVIKKIVDKNTTDSELNTLKEAFEKEGLAIKFKGVKRNNKGEIMAIKIDAKSKNSNTAYQVKSDDEAIKPISILFDKEKNQIVIGHNELKTKDTIIVESNTADGYTLKNTDKGEVIIITEENVMDKNEREEERKIIVKGNANNGKIKMVKRSKNVEIISGDDKDVEIIIEEDQDDENEVIIVNGNRIKVDDKAAKIIIEESKNNIWTDDNKQIETKDNNNQVITLNKSKRISLSGFNGKNPLYIIDGEEVTKKEFSKLDPDHISEMTVLKDESATKAYGNKAKNGVIIVKTKKK